jgi:hypothetical protein
MAHPDPLRSLAPPAAWAVLTVALSLCDGSCLPAQ